MGCAPWDPTVLPRLLTNGASSVTRFRPPREHAVHTALKHGSELSQGVLAQTNPFGIRSTYTEVLFGAMPIPRSHPRPLSTILHTVCLSESSGMDVPGSWVSQVGRLVGRENMLWKVRRLRQSSNTALCNGGTSWQYEVCAAHPKDHQPPLFPGNRAKNPDHELWARVSYRAGLLIRAPTFRHCNPTKYHCPFPATWRRQRVQLSGIWSAMGRHGQRQSFSPRDAGSDRPTY